MNKDTIAAVSTPVGQAGIGIVRLSGPKSIKIIARLFRPARGGKLWQNMSHRLHYGWIVEKEKAKKVDEVLVSVMKAPLTYTKEDIVEINCHSGIVPLKRILELTLKNGARLAGPGEFTRRAFMNGRINLSQAEAVCEIINAKSEAYHKAALARLENAAQKELFPLRESLLEELSLIQAGIDFPDDVSLGQTTNLKKIKAMFDKLLENASASFIYREGISVAICGSPNVGKSSLFNALINKDRCLVSSVAGTTRDLIEESFSFKGVNFRLIDTAGLGRETFKLEKMASARTKNVLQSAGLIIAVFDNSLKLSKNDQALIEILGKRKNVIALINKSDLISQIDRNRIRQAFKSYSLISAKTGAGIATVKKSMLKNVWAGKALPEENQLLLSSREEELVRKSFLAFINAESLLKKAGPLEICAEHMKEAITCIDMLLGRPDQIDSQVLDQVFSKFCIGK